MKRIHTILAGSVIGLLLYRWWISSAEKKVSPSLPGTTNQALMAHAWTPQISTSTRPLSAMSLTSQMRAAIKQEPTLTQQAPVRTAPEQLVGDIQATPGTTYQATIVVHAPASWMANVDKVRRYAEGEGFTNVSVSKSAPAGWLGARGDYHVTATYAGEPRVFERSHGGGQVQLTDAWRV